MPAGAKRKASFASPYERPSKINKRSSSATVSRALSGLTKRVSAGRPPLALPKFPSLTAKKSTIEVSESAPLPNMDSPTHPSLRRASTLTLEDESKDGSKAASRDSSAKRPSSMSKKSSSFVEEGALVTRLSGLKSGSVVGETSLATSSSLNKEPSLTKSLSKKSSTKEDIPSIPSGLTKLALPAGGSAVGSLRVSKSTLVTDVDETEMSSALDSLKTHLSKEGSKKRTSMTKSASRLSKSSSVRSGKSDKVSEDTDAAGEAETAMDTSEASASSADIGASTSTDSAEAVMPPPGDGPMEVAISFDTTGSMYSCLTEVRAKVQDLVQRLQSDIPGIRVAVIAHGDYCDVSTYVVKWIDFGASLPEICDFVKNVQSTGGGDGPECYELVLQRAREVLSWTPGSKRILIMIGDDVPHEPGYTYGGKTYYINWRDECTELKKMNVKIYGVQAGHGSTYESPAKKFNDEMARITGGKRLTLKNFGCLFDVLMMICYREGNPEMLAVYEQEIIDRGEKLADDIHTLKKTFDMPSRPTPAAKGPTAARKRGPVPAKVSAKAAKPKVTKKTDKKAKTTPVVTKGTAKKAAEVKVKAKVARVAAVKKVKVAKKQLKKSKKEAKMQKREKLPDSCMSKGPLKSIVWSNWVAAIVPKLPTGKNKSNYVKLRTNNGYGLKKIFDGNFKTSAIYEVAVQAPDWKKKYVVYFRMSKRGFCRSGLWATNLLRHKKVRKEVDSVLKQDCTIFLRRGVPKAKSESKQAEQMTRVSDFIRDNYDYAWKKYIWRKSDLDVKLGAVGKVPFGLKHRLIKITRKGKTFILSDDKI